MSKKTVRKAYRTQKHDGKRVPYVGSLKVNNKKIKRLKSQIFKLFKREFGIKERVKTHPDKNPSKCLYLYLNFQAIWNEWKKVNKDKLSAILDKPNHSFIYKEVMEQNGG